MAKYKVNHDINLTKENKRLTKGQEIDLTVKRVEEIHAALEQQKAWKHIVPVFERIEE